MWSKWPCVMRMVSMRENLCPAGYFGLPSVHGSTKMTSPEGSWNWNVPCPSQVICIGDYFTAEGDARCGQKRADRWPLRRVSSQEKFEQNRKKSQRLVERVAGAV